MLGADESEHDGDSEGGEGGKGDGAGGSEGGGASDDRTARRALSASEETAHVEVRHSSVLPFFHARQTLRAVRKGHARRTHPYRITVKGVL
jgi:hypothetical protein